MRQMYFADTSYFIALLDADDDWHLVADRFARSFKGTILTTGCVLLELGAFFSSPVARPAFARLDQLIRHRKDVIYVPLDAALHDAGTELFLARSDKEWSGGLCQLCGDETLRPSRCTDDGSSFRTSWVQQ